MQKSTKSALFLISVPIIIVATLVLQYLIVNLVGRQIPTDDRNIIDSLPFDPTQIESITKFRNCQNGNFGGYNAKGEYESNRSLKHTLRVTPTYRGTSGQVEVYAPFSGKVVEKFIAKGKTELRLKQEKSEWHFVLFDITTVPWLDVNKLVKSGELIGYANQNPQGEFDFGMQYSRDLSIISRLSISLGFGEISHLANWDTPFAYMTPQVLSSIARYGITPQSIQHSKEFRDNKPCDSANLNSFVTEDTLTLQQAAAM